MAQRNISGLKEKLLKERQGIVEHLQGIESGWQALGERDIEWEEEAQKSNITRLFNILDLRDREKLHDIELALNKIATASYGFCEKCRKPISQKRLTIVPETRFCRKCAH